MDNPVDIIESSIFDEIDSIAADCSKSNWNGDQSEPIGEQTVLYAKKLVSLFPNDIAVPDVVPEPDGSIGFEWDIDQDQWMIVSVNEGGSIYYAVKFDEHSKSDGKIDFNMDKVNLMFDMLKIIQQVHE